MKKIIIIISLLASLILISTSCDYDHGSIRGYGSSIETEVNIDIVTGIELNGSMDIEIIPSDTFRVVIIAQQNIADLMVIEVLGNVAKVDYRPRINVIPTDVAKVVFYMPVLESISLDGSGDIYVADEFESEYNNEIKINGSGNIDIEGLICNKLETTINGSGDISINCVCNEAETVIRGSGNISYNGNASTHTIRITGSGDVDAFDFFTESTYIDISGSGDAFVWAENLLDIYISGSGDVTYKGNPELSIDIPGSGNVNSWK